VSVTRATGGPKVEMADLMKMAIAAREGRASEDDARTLITLFCGCIEHGLVSASDPSSNCLLEYVREAFQAYLDGKRVGSRDVREVGGIEEVGVGSVEAALGLVRKIGRPKMDGQMRIRMAAEVLHHRLNGMSHQEALAAASEELRKGVTAISEAWAAYKSYPYPASAGSLNVLAWSLA